jgi:hypothetical protein
MARLSLARDPPSASAAGAGRSRPARPAPPWRTRGNTDPSRRHRQSSLTAKPVPEDPGGGLWTCHQVIRDAVDSGALPAFAPGPGVKAASAYISRGTAVYPHTAIYTPIGYAPVIVGQKRRNAPPMTHDQAKAPNPGAVSYPNGGNVCPAFCHGRHLTPFDPQSWPETSAIHFL